MGYVLREIQARHPEAMNDGFSVMIDLAPLPSSEQVYRIFDLYTPEILGFVRLVDALDFVMPLAFALPLARVAGIATVIELVGLGLTGLMTVALLLRTAAKLVTRRNPST